MTNIYKFQGVETTTATDRDGALVGYYRGTPVARLAGDVVTLKTGGWVLRADVLKDLYGTIDTDYNKLFTEKPTKGEF